MDRIAVLSEELVNKIAAGEVVERPASVVKELCENALDAGARSIRVKLSGGGLERIVVADDGVGMSRGDAVLAMTRHATSKLKNLEGLFAIETLGFRGEALPAIASVSRFRLTTAEPGAAVGTRVVVQGGSSLEVLDAAPAPGTEVVVEDLFFNTPARRTFMRRESTESKHGEEAVLRLALAHPEIGFALEVGGEVVLSSPPDTTLAERAVAALGAAARAHLLPVEERRLGVSIDGFVAAPSFTLANARGLYTFVNHRYVRDRGLIAAVQRAFSEQLPAGRQPVAVLRIEVDPAAVDVNVHPQKMEVRFFDGRGVYDAVLGGVRRALQPSVARAAEASELFATEASYASAVDRFLARAASTGSPLPLAMDAPADEGQRPGFGTRRPDVNAAPPPGYFSGLRYLGVLGRRFWVCEGRGATLVAIDPHAARERVALASLGRALAAGTLADQRSLFGASIELAASQMAALTAALPALAALGFDAEPFGGSALALKSVPQGLESVDAPALLKDLAAVLVPGPVGETAQLAPALRIVACHAAGGEEREPSHEECGRLFARLDGADFQAAARHSGIVLEELTFLELERRAAHR
jgi:DNA mismatch repair protein MutL